jgi:Bacterial membrane protein YfhO
MSEWGMIMTNSKVHVGFLERDVKVGMGVLFSYALFYVLFFSPSIIDHKLLAPGDGFIFYYPAIERPFTIWSNLILSGYPTFADSQFLTWYPLKLIGLHYNGVVISAYILASYFAYGLCRRITGSHSAGALGGLIYGMSGFMAAHMGHLTIINAAAWVPLLLWSLDHVTTRPTTGWWLIGAAAIACMFLAGHPQIFVYGLLLAGGFAIYRMAGTIQHSRSMTLHIGAACVGLVMMGLALAAIQILPLIEVSSSSVRQTLIGQQGWTFQDFTSYSVPFGQLPMLLLFPNLFGTILPTGSGYFNLVPYFGAWNLAELACYFGITTLLLALIALGSRSILRSQALFWATAALVSVVFALGKATPLAYLAFHFPVVGSFRAPARSAMILDLSLAVLASIGLKSLVDKTLHRKAVSRACVSLAVMLLGATAYVCITYPAIRKQFDLKVAGGDYHLPQVVFNPAVYCPILLGVIGFIAVFLIARDHFRAGYLVLFATVAIDLGLFGYYGSGRAWETDAGRSQMDSTWQAVKDDLVAHHGRLLPLENNGSDVSPGSQIINMIRGIPSAGGYGPLMQESYARATGMDLSGFLAQPRADSPLFKILDVRWILSNGPSLRPLLLGAGSCGTWAAQKSVQIHLPAPAAATRLHVVSYMVCSTTIAQNEEVLQIHLGEAGGTSKTISLLAGRDTSEWAIDRSDVAQLVRHQKATVFSSSRGGGFLGHTYETSLPVGSASPLMVQDIAFDWQPQAGMILASEITLIDDTTGSQYTVSVPLGMPVGDDWDQPITTPKKATLQRYRQGLGPAWLVHDVRPMGRAEIAQAIDMGRLPDQSAFDPGRTALVETASASLHPEPTNDPDGHVDVLEMKPEHWGLDVLSTKPAFLVISQLYYPGWGVNVNGHRESLYRTNYAFQAVAVPAGHSRVDLSFRPRSLLYGGGITLVAILASLCLVSRSVWIRRRSVSEREKSMQRSRTEHHCDPATPVAPHRNPP